MTTTLPGFGDRASAPHLWAMMEAPDPPECDRCGHALTTWTDADEDGVYGGTDPCPACEKRREMHRDRGRQLCQRERRLDRDRKPQADRLWYAKGRTQGPTIPFDHPEAARRRAELDALGLPF